MNYELRAKVREWARLSPFGSGFVAPSDTNAATVEAIVNFYRKVLGAVVDVAYDKVQAAIISFPPTGSSDSEQLLLAKQTLPSPAGTTSIVLDLLLAHFDADTSAQIAARDDTEIKTFVEDVWPVIAFGIRR